MEGIVFYPVIFNKNINVICFESAPEVPSLLLSFTATSTMTVHDQTRPKPCPVYKPRSDCTGSFKLLFFLFVLSFWSKVTLSMVQIHTANPCPDSIKVCLAISRQNRKLSFFWGCAHVSLGQAQRHNSSADSPTNLTIPEWGHHCWWNFAPSVSLLSVYLFLPIKGAKGRTWMNLIQIFCPLRIKSDNGISFCRGKTGGEERLDSLLV